MISGKADPTATRFHHGIGDFRTTVDDAIDNPASVPFVPTNNAEAAMKAIQFESGLPTMLQMV